MQIRFIENNDSTVTVQGRKPGGKWSTRRKPLRTIKAVPGWNERLRNWARKQGHKVVEQTTTT